MTVETLKMAMAAMADPKAKASEVANRLGITTTTLYAYVNGDGSVKEPGQRLLNPPPGFFSHRKKKLMGQTNQGEW